MLEGKIFLDYTNLFCPNDYEKNDKIILKYEKIIKRSKKMKKLYCVICGKYRNFEKRKTSYLLGKTLGFSIIISKCKNEDEI